MATLQDLWNISAESSGLLPEEVALPRVHFEVCLMDVTRVHPNFWVGQQQALIPSEGCVPSHLPGHGSTPQEVAGTCGHRRSFPQAGVFSLSSCLAVSQ